MQMSDIRPTDVFTTTIMMFEDSAKAAEAAAVLSCVKMVTDCSNLYVKKYRFVVHHSVVFKVHDQES